jgi:hypothetical protein
MIRTALFLAVLSGTALQTTAPSLKLYVFDCGTLKSGNPAPLLERGVTTTEHVGYGLLDRAPTRNATLGDWRDPG